MAEPAHCPRCDKPYADRTGQDPCPRCGAENPSIKAAAERDAREHHERLKQKLKLESQRVRAVADEERVARGDPTQIAAAARVSSKLASGAFLGLVHLAVAIVALLGVALVVAGVFESIGGPLQPLVLLLLGAGLLRTAMNATHALGQAKENDHAR